MWEKEGEWIKGRKSPSARIGFDRAIQSCVMTICLHIHTLDKLNGMLGLMTLSVLLP